jgi:predicted transcriptional regulator
MSKKKRYTVYLTDGNASLLEKVAFLTKQTRTYIINKSLEKELQTMIKDKNLSRKIKEIDLED